MRGTANAMTTAIAMTWAAGVRSSGNPGSWPPLVAEFRYLSCTLRSHPITSNFFPEFCDMSIVANWTFPTNHAWALLCIAQDPEMRLRDIRPPDPRAPPRPAPGSTRNRAARAFG
jgi:hypothetical protein